MPKRTEEVVKTPTKVVEKEVKNDKSAKEEVKAPVKEVIKKSPLMIKVERTLKNFGVEEVSDIVEQKVTLDNDDTFTAVFVEFATEEKENAAAMGVFLFKFLSEGLDLVNYSFEILPAKEEGDISVLAFRDAPKE